jgi:hypothetical protein
MGNDILIIPGESEIQFSGSAVHKTQLQVQPSGSVSIEGSGSTLFQVEGTLGSLFTVSDVMSGSIFSVNTVAGLPVIEAFSDYSVIIGPFHNPLYFNNPLPTGSDAGLITGSVWLSGSGEGAASGSGYLMVAGRRS